MFNLNNLQVDILKKFDGVANYFNPSHFNGKTIFRRESKFENKLLVSDIVDDQDNVILHHFVDDNYLCSYEDARFINENEISVCCCKRDKNDLVKIINVEFKKYNLTTKEFTHFKTQNAHFEKHWQFYSDKIIYHVNPYTILDENENVIFKQKINWQPWIERFGCPGLSTNIFEVDGLKYLLFHSYKNVNFINLNYYCGLLRLDSQLKPIAYYWDTLFPSFNKYECNLQLEYYNWRRNLNSFPTIVDVIFPSTVNVTSDKIEIYAGINDCISSKIIIKKADFLNIIYNVPAMIL
jgi:hypothetical protein